MASPVELCRAVAQVTGFQYATVDSTWKLLRAQNLVVNSGKGHRGTQVSAHDAAVLLTALCGVVHIGDAAPVVRRFAKSGFVSALATTIEHPIDGTEVRVHAEKTLATIDKRAFGNSRSLKAALLDENVQTKSPIADLGDMFFIRGFSDRTIKALHRLLMPKVAIAA